MPREPLPAPDKRSSLLYYSAMEKTLRGKPLSVWQRVSVASRMAVAWLLHDEGERWWDGVDEKTVVLAGRIALKVGAELWGEDAGT